MSSFTEPLALEPAGTLWRTTRPFAFEIGKKGSGLTVTVPEATLTDLGSIPRLLWPILPPHEPSRAAAFVLHDALLQDREFDRRIADCLLLHALTVLGVNWLPRWAMFLGVRLYALTRRA